jgi:hypothetical protein
MNKQDVNTTQEQEDNKVRNLSKHTGVLSEVKRDKASKNYLDLIEEFEAETYGREPHNLK